MSCVGHLWRKGRCESKGALELASILKNTQLQAIPGAGHEINVEAPEKLAELLCDFFLKPEINR